MKEEMETKLQENDKVNAELEEEYTQQLGQLITF